MTSTSCNLEGKAKSQLYELAWAAEQADRYDDMAAVMKQLVESQKQAKEKLSETERNLLSVAYKNVVGRRRSAWRTISNVELKCSEDRKRQLTKSYKHKIENELNRLCEEVLVSFYFCLCVSCFFPHYCSVAQVKKIERERVREQAYI